MKRFTKMALILSLVLVILGSMFCVISLGIGFSFSEFWKSVEDGNYSFDTDDIPIIGGNNRLNWKDDGADWKSVSTEEYTFPWNGSGEQDKIDRMDVKAYYGTVIIQEKTADTEKVQVTVEYRKENHKRQVKAYKDGSTLKIKETGSKRSIQNDSTRITIQIPADMKSMKEIALEQGAGEIFVDTPLTAEEINITVDAGECQVSRKLTAQESCKAEVGAGEIDLAEMEAQNLVLDAGVGEITTGQITAQDIRINCGVGSIETVAAGTEQDYSYEIKCSVGDVEIGDNSYAGLGSKRKIDNPGNQTMQVDCGVGEVEVSFAGTGSQHHEESDNHEEFHE